MMINSIINLIAKNNKIFIKKIENFNLMIYDENENEKKIIILNDNESFTIVKKNEWFFEIIKKLNNDDELNLKSINNDVFKITSNI